MSKVPYGLQLYTVRDHLQINPASTLRKVKGAGYVYAELAGTANLEANLFKKLICDAGLKAISAHLPYELIVDDTDAAIKFARLFEISYLVAPMIDPAMTPDPESWTACGETLGRAGARLRKAGIRLCYHNHAHEFQQIGDELPIDLLAKAAQPEDLAFELDVYWIKYAGQDPAGAIEKFAGRCPLLHIKDMAAKSRAFAEIGRGVVNWPVIFERGAAAGVEWYIVEQDTCPHDSIESARISAMYLGER